MNPNVGPESGSVHGGESPTTASAKPTTTIGVIFGATPGMPGMFKSNFDYQLVRGMLAGAYGEGGAFGELYSTARRIVDRDINSWAVEWGRTAERIEAIAVGWRLQVAAEKFSYPSCCEENDSAQFKKGED
jgi:hypothetical protein